MIIPYNLAKKIHFLPYSKIKEKKKKIFLNECFFDTTQM